MANTIQAINQPYDKIESAKALGAFYTDVQVADFLVWWAIRSGRDAILDPSFGGGVFLRSGCERLLELGGNPAFQVHGYEIDEHVHDLIAEKLADEFGVRKTNLHAGDFFDTEPLPVNQVDAIIGNPPYIRYQRFAGQMRAKAIQRANEQGVRLNELSSSWAPFIIYSVAFVKKGGRLAMVLPMELVHATYAMPVLKYLITQFGKITLLTFQKKLFPDLNEHTLLLLAEDKGDSHSKLFTRDLIHSGVLSEIQDRMRLPLDGTRQINSLSLARGSERLVEYLIPKKTRQLYQELRQSAGIQRLGNIADVGIGYVTGANEFFHLSPETVSQWKIPDRFLRPAVRRGRGLSGLRFTHKDWQTACEIGEAGYLLAIEPNLNLPQSVKDYLKYGEKHGVAETYKCRTRTPWFSVPHIRRPDAFLTYMSGEMPRLVTNHADAVAPNSLHILRMHTHITLKGDALAALWQTSLTRLSAEIEGHALGGGMLKIEPTEAENILVGTEASDNGHLVSLSKEFDRMVRCGNLRDVVELADKVILQKQIGLSKSDCKLLSAAAENLRNRRYSRRATT